MLYSLHSMHSRVGDPNVAVDEEVGGIIGGDAELEHPRLALGHPDEAGEDVGLRHAVHDREVHRFEDVDLVLGRVGGPRLFVIVRDGDGVLEELALAEVTVVPLVTGVRKVLACSADSILHLLCRPCVSLMCEHK